VLQDPHTIDNLLPDMLNSAMVAGLGLMGAYVTRGAEGVEPTPSEQRMQGRPSLSGLFDDDDFDDAFMDDLNR